MLGRVLAEGHHPVDEIQRSQNRHAAFQAVYRAPCPFDTSHRCIIVNRHNQPITKLAGFFQVGDVTGVQNVENAIGHHQAFVVPCGVCFGAQRIGRLLDQQRLVTMNQGYRVRLRHCFSESAQQATGESDRIPEPGEKCERIRKTYPARTAGCSEALVQYCEQPPPDTLLLLVCGRLDARTRKMKWVKSVEKAGRVVEHRAVAGDGLWADRVRQGAAV